MKPNRNMLLITVSAILVISIGLFWIVPKIQTEIEDSPGKQIIHAFMQAKGMDIHPGSQAYQEVMKGILLGDFPEFTGEDSAFITSEAQKRQVLQYAWRHSGYAEQYKGNTNNGDLPELRPTHTEIDPQIDATPAPVREKPSPVPDKAASMPATIQLDSFAIQIDPSYFDGFIFLTNFYEFLDRSFSELDSTDPDLQNQLGQMYSRANLAKHGGVIYWGGLRSIKVRYIQPYDYWLALQGISPQVTTKPELYFVVGTTKIYTGAGFNPGGTPTPYDEITFIRLISENDEWKIDNITGSPWWFPADFAATATPFQSDPSSALITPNDFDGFIVLSRYFILLDHGLKEEVRTFHSKAFLNRFGSDTLIFDLKSVKVRFIYPYNYWLAQNGQPPEPTAENEIRFVVGTMVIHNSPSLNPGGTPTPYSETSFVSLVEEDGEWKINGSGTSP